MSVLGYNETHRETTELSEDEAIKVTAFGLDRPEVEVSDEQRALVLDQVADNFEGTTMRSEQVVASLRFAARILRTPVVTS